MPEEDKPNLPVEMVKAVGEVLEKVPVYQDAVQPAAKEVGKGLQIIAKAVNAALTPVEGLIWGIENIRDFVRERVAKKLEFVPEENIQQPKPHIAVPAIEALRYTGAEPDLSELYANLLAASMDSTTAQYAHPGFVDIIKNMCPDEARVMKFLSTNRYYPVVDIRLVSITDNSFQTSARSLNLIGFDSGCQHPTLSPTYLDNLARLGLIEVQQGLRMAKDDFYTRIEEYPAFAELKVKLSANEGWRVEFEKFRLAVTDLGTQFINSCVLSKETS